MVKSSIGIDRGGFMRFFRDTWLEIDLDAIYQNVSNIKKYYAKDKKIFAVVKANAYGHGAVMVAKTALKAGASYLAVATLDEAQELRKNKIKVPILVLGNMRVDDLGVACEYDITVTAHNINWLEEAVNNYKGKTVKIHFKLDTGMNRIGFVNKEELIHATNLINNSKHFDLTGIFTHMATSEENDELYFKMQQSKFKSLIESIDTTNLLIHLSNSAATIKYLDSFTNAVRIGIVVYGLSPKKDMKIDFDLKQAVSLYSKLIQVKKIPKGSKIGYNGTFETKKEEWIGSIPIGYADGWDRRMINGIVYIDGNFCDIVGTICMDQVMVKLPYQIKEGTTVELIGPNIHVDEVSVRIKTINYHTVCLLSDRLPRVFISKGKVIRIENKRL